VLIAHLSDLHMRDADDVIWLERQLDRIGSRGVDHLAITGDLLDRWSPPILSRALDAFASRAWLDPDRLTILHGNHDLASSGGHPRRRADLWRLATRFWDPPVPRQLAAAALLSCHRETLRGATEGLVPRGTSGSIH
jgi:3',5'-cyclic AMP phosphodiesterase CpdA